MNDWSTNTIHAKILEDKELYVVAEGQAFCLSSNKNKLSMAFCDRLSSEQEEADTRVFLCAQHFNSRHRSGYLRNLFSVHVQYEDLLSIWVIISNDNLSPV